MFIYIHYKVSLAKARCINKYNALSRNSAITEGLVCGIWWAKQEFVCGIIDLFAE